MGLIGLVLVFYLFFFMSDSKNAAAVNGASNRNFTSPIKNIVTNITNAANSIINTGAANKNQGVINKLNNSIVSTFSNVKSLINGNENQKE